MSEKKVAVIGGGVAGLTAAHELAERGFEVHVYERRPHFGGKAASYRVPQGGAQQPTDYDPPGEHGFRFFPGWYRHLTHTLSRIPFHRQGGGRRTVLDNLVSVRTNLIASFDRAPIALPLKLPGTLEQATTLSKFIAEFSRLGLSASEVALFFRKMVEFLAASDQKREEVLDDQTWWEFLECEKPGRSQAYRDLVRATTRTSVAAKAEEASAYTIGRLAVRTLLDTMSDVDRVLNGPTNEVWIEPWVNYLKGRGVRFHPNQDLKAIAFDSESRKVRHLVMEPVVVGRMRRLRRRVRQHLSAEKQAHLRTGRDRNALRQSSDSVRESLNALEADLEAIELRTALRALGKARDRCSGADDSVDRQGRLRDYEDACEGLELQISAREQSYPVDADYFVLALPLEQVAYQVNRTTMLGFLAPELRDVIRLQRSMDWMAGIQFYFECPLDIATGHIVGLDSDWALTAVEQTQFWDDVKLQGNVKAVLSVDIAAWNKKGRKIRKAAFHCTPDEIAEEVWAQLTEMLNRSKRLPVLSENMLVGGKLERNVSYHLDESIIEREDRKKQALYERAKTLAFGLTGELADENDAEEQFEEGFMWGEHSVLNTEPLLINRVGTRKLRPDARTSIPNLFLAGDYVRTETDLACMEGANEAARRAVNGILEQCASREPLCEIWPFSPSRQAAEGMMGLLAPTQAVRNVATAVSSLPGKLWKTFSGGE